MNPLSTPTTVVEALACQHAPHNGMDLPGMAYLLANAAQAHLDAPGGLSVEVGSFCGETSVALLELLGALYKPGPVPYLFTVDPYGEKVYNSGDTLGMLDYTADHYTVLKARTLLYTQHTHFMLPGTMFFDLLIGAPYWVKGVEKRVGGFTFVFLDGEHDLATVKAELDLVRPHMRTGGRIVIDNVDKDPALIPYLRSIGCRTTAPGHTRPGQMSELGPESAKPGQRQALLVVS